MISTLAKAAVAVCVAYRLYKLVEKAMLEDPDYLAKTTGCTRESAEKMLDEAKKHAKDKEYELSAEYFYHAYKLLGSGWDHIVSLVDSPEVLKLLYVKKHQGQ